MTILPKKKGHPKDRYATNRSHPSNALHGGMSPPSATVAYSTSNSGGASGSKIYAKPPPPNLTLTGCSPRSPGVENNMSMLPSSSGYPKKVKKHAGNQSPVQNHTGINLALPCKNVKKKMEEEANSDDEYGVGFRDEELEIRFAERLKKSRGLVVKEVKGDGACMFRAVADQIYGDEEMHDDVRRLCMDYIAQNRDHFSQFVTEDFEAYLQRKREPDTHGNHVELQAISEIYSRPIEIYEYSIDPINIFHPITPEANAGNVNAPLRLSYHGTVHYNSVVDPYAATIGVGLGLPEFKPGLAERNLMKEAIRASENHHIEETMLKDKLAMTDWQRTEEDLAKQVSKESYLNFLHHMERQGRPLSPLQVAQEDPPTTSSKAPKPKAFGLGTKRGASSPNIPCCSRDEQFRYPVPKMHKEDNTSSSMPNIGPTFGASLYTNNPAVPIQPLSLTMSIDSTQAEKLAAAKQTEDKLVEKTKEPEDKPGPSNPLTVGLYEELLASSSFAFDDWGADAEYDETAMLAQALALSQQEFFDSLKKSPKPESSRGRQ